jgi:two-component system, NarL family, nitrate/nitrite response regulator NarL
MNEIVRVAVIDDHPIFRAGVIEALSMDPALDVVAEGDSAASACEIATNFSPDLMLLDIQVNGSGIEAVPNILNISPSTKIMMLTASESEDDVVSSLNAGARGFIVKGANGAELARAVHAVHEGNTYITSALSARLLLRPRNSTPVSTQVSRLTCREQQVSHCVALGMTNKEIALHCSMSEKTVKHHMTIIMEKSGVRNRVELALMVAHDSQFLNADISFGKKPAVPPAGQH